MASPLSQFTGEVIYLDTMLLYGLLRSIDPAIQLFFQRIEQGELRALTSVLTFDELAYRLLLALIKDKYSGSALDQLRTAEEKVISEFAPRVTAELERLRVFPNLTMLDVLVSDLEVMNRAITQ